MLSKPNFLKRKEQKREGKIEKIGGGKKGWERKNGQKKLKHRHKPRLAMHFNEGK